MQISAKHCLIATLYLALSASALPYPVSYSVVNVDGGSLAPYTSPTTVYQTVTEPSEAETTTISATPTTTAVITDYTTEWAHAEATETALIPVVTGPPHLPEGSEYPTFYPPIPVPTSPLPVEDSTVTVVSTVTPTPTTTTSYYDDGMWHTSYAIKDFDSVPSSQWAPSVPAVSYAATGTGAGLYGRAQPTGYGYSAGGWNSTGYWK